MLTLVTEELLAGDAYYRGRWAAYMAEAVAWIREGVGDTLAAAEVLELGAYTQPLVQGCHTMDVRAALAPTYLHDARQCPWPVADGQYGLFVANQVLEHLGDPRDGAAQCAAFAEIRRICRGPVMVSLPYNWPPAAGWHGGILHSMVTAWAGRAPDRYRILGAQPRLLCWWDELS
jgi:hypothetical protein